MAITTYLGLRPAAVAKLPLCDMYIRMYMLYSTQCYATTLRVILHTLYTKQIEDVQILCLLEAEKRYRRTYIKIHTHTCAHTHTCTRQYKYDG